MDTRIRLPGSCLLRACSVARARPFPCMLRRFLSSHTVGTGRDTLDLVHTWTTSKAMGIFAKWKHMGTTWSVSSTPTESQLCWIISDADCITGFYEKTQNKTWLNSNHCESRISCKIECWILGRWVLIFIEPMVVGSWRPKNKLTQTPYTVLAPPMKNPDPDCTSYTMIRI